MPYRRLVASLLAVALCLVANQSLAEQISGQLHISLTILKRCEVSAERDQQAVRVLGNGCEQAAYQLQDGHGRALPLKPDAGAASVSTQSVADAGSTLVVYW